MTKRTSRLANIFRLLGCCCVAVQLLASPVAGQDDPSRSARQHAQAAQQAQREGDFATAIREFTILSRLLPDVAEVHSNLGVAYYFHKQRGEALAAFEKALQLKPNLISALIFSGIANYELSKPAPATKLLERAVELSPADPLAQIWLAHSYAAQSRFREAVEHFLAASEHSPNDVDIWYGLGQAYMELGRQEVERLTEIAPKGSRILQLAGDLWLLRAASDNALALYQEALKRRPGLTEVQQIVAQLLGRQGKSQPMEVSPSPPVPAVSPTPEDLHYLAATQFRERARRAFERIPALGANSYRAHQVLAESLQAQGRADEALAEYRAALNLKPDLAGIHREIGDLLMGEGRVTEALEEYRAELLLRPNDAQVHYRMGRTLIVLGKGEDAEASLNQALALGGGPPAAHKELGRIYVNRGQPAKAVQSLSTYLKSAANDALAHYLLMRAYRALGDAAAAERHLAKHKSLSDDEKQRASAQAALSLFSRGKKPE
ncbi:MAG: tetratricopeptide repeat protein [Acidobacteria bacterium]|nr:tetratricopeptide repeat protein [Acidobacteriota bacterium]